MKFLTVGTVFFLCVALVLGDEGDRSKKEGREGNKKEVRAATKEPKVGHWNVTSQEGKDSSLCIEMDGGIRLDIIYETKNGSKETTTIVSDEDTVVDRGLSRCKNSSLDHDEVMALRFSQDRLLTLSFSRDHNVTGDNKEEKWQLYKIVFAFKYDDDFPGAKNSGKQGKEENTDPLNDIASTRGKSYGCTKMNPLKVSDNFTLTLNNFRVQPFMTSEDFGQADWCANEQTSDLIPIIVGAALAALVIIVLIAYLVGRARARTTTYDNI